MIPIRVLHINNIGTKVRYGGCQGEKEQVYQWVQCYVEPASSAGGRLINEMRETRFKEGFECPYYTSGHVVRFGKYNGRQRYRCKCCDKTFTDTTNTVLYRTRKGNEFDCIYKGYSLRKYEIS